MTSQTPSPKLSLWPFVLVDALFLGLAGVIYHLANRPLLPWQAALLVVCVSGAALSILFPILRQDSSTQAMARIHAMAESIAQINRLDQVSSQIATATSQWQAVQGFATQIADTSKELSKTMSAEVRTFGEFLQKANDSEKAHLRLEVDKLRRSEIEWLQVLTRVLDHVYALYSAAVRSGQPQIVAQITHFQEGCRDTVRRLGLLPLLAEPGEVFDAKVHQLADSEDAPPKNALIAATLATGYSYQGQLLRKAVVSLQSQGETPAASLPQPGELGL